MMDSLEDKDFPFLPKQIQECMYFEFDSIEEHFKYREYVMKSYPYGKYPIFEGYNHMQYQIQDPKGFVDMLKSIIEKNEMPKLKLGDIISLI